MQSRMTIRESGIGKEPIRKGRIPDYSDILDENRKQILIERASERGYRSPESKPVDLRNLDRFPNRNRNGTLVIGDIRSTFPRVERAARNGGKLRW